MTSELHTALRAHGAVLGALRGVTAPIHFGDSGREWRAAREGAAVFVATYRSLLAATGEDRVAFLQGMLTNDVKALEPGTSVYAAFLTQQGRVVTDLRVLADPDRLLLDVLAWRRDALRESLERFIVADDVELAPPPETPLIGLVGPLAAAVAGEAIGTTDLPRTLYTHRRAAVQGAPLLVVAVPEVGVEALLFCGAPESAAPLFDACVEAGARPLGMAALDAIRVERGVPWAGVDMDDSTLLMETGCDAAISFTKGCYLGQEVVERVAARGHVNRHLTGVRLDVAEPPASGVRLLAEGHEVGYVTSAVRSPALGRVIALAMVQRKHAAVGGRLEIETGGSGTVSALPFVPGPTD